MSLNSQSAKSQLTLAALLGLMGMAFLLTLLYSTLRGGVAFNMFLFLASPTLLIAYPVMVSLSLHKSGRSLNYARRGLAVAIVLSAICLAVAAVPWAQASAARSHGVSNLLVLAMWALAGSWVGVTILVEGIELTSHHAA